MLPNPYELIGEAASGLFAMVAIASTAIFLWVLYHGRKLKMSGVDKGVVSLELCWSGRRANEILDAWRGESLVDTAIANVRWDFLFIPFYAAAIGLYCGWAATRATDFWALILVSLAWSQAVAAVLDVIENLAMLRMLKADVVNSGRLPRIATLCAAIKFCFVFLGLGLALLKTFV